VKPRFQIGDEVFVPRTVRTNKDEVVTCPECLGERTWKVTTPTGEEFPVGCRRCERGWDGPTGRVPAPHQWVAEVEAVVVRQVELNERKDADPHFEYNHQREVFATREEAMEVAQKLVAIREEADLEQRRKDNAAKLREVNRPHGRVAREDLRDALIVETGLALDPMPRSIAERVYHRLTGGRLPRRVTK
jgi:hypothetical protein